METEASSSVYKEVQGLSRGLAVLRALGASPGGQARLVEISSATGLHRTTVRRLLETLRREGFVEYSEDGRFFRLTLEINRIADGFNVYDKLAVAAEPILRELSSTVTWPCSLATPHDDYMLIRQATHGLSPLSFHRGVIGRQLPMLMTSMGRAYLAFSTKTVCEHTLSVIAAKYEQGEVPLMSLFAFRQILSQTQTDGYGSNYGEWRDDKKVAAIAVPVKDEGGAVVACINVVANTRALKPKKLAEKFLQPLRASAAALESAILGNT